jgi:hypothetical protein
VSSDIDLALWRRLHEDMESGRRPDLTSYWCPHLPHRWYPESSSIKGREVIVDSRTFKPVFLEERCLGCLAGAYTQMPLWHIEDEEAGGLPRARALARV